MSNILSNLNPEPVFRYFEEICGIPHGSGNTKAISDYLVSFAVKHGLRYQQDSDNNIIIWKKGSAGCEKAAPVMMQGHIDMVCEKESGCPINMEKDGLSLVLENGIISADGTTLGGDDGIAVAYALAILESNEIPHPPLEVVLTVDEEIGMLGASSLDCSELKARTMLNLDSEDEGYLLVSCAGGATAIAHFPIETKSAEGIVLNLSLTGLIGGHSGVEIDKGRANACHLLGRTLYTLAKTAAIRLVEVHGGLKDNAIPREAYATLLVENDSIVQALQTKVQELDRIYKDEYRVTDSSVTLRLTQAETKETQVMTEDSTVRILTALVCLPNGIERMSFDMKGLVQTSLNLGILTTVEKEVSFSFAVRSSVESEKQALIEKITCLTEALSGTIRISGSYPAWEYREDSPLRKTMITVFEQMYGKKPVVQSIHAGVECGLFAGKLPGLDCVSFGPDMKNIHTTEESMDTESVRRTWEYLLEILKQLSKKETAHE